MKKKANWGTGIFISYVLFMGITILTAVYFMNQDVNLVIDDYYQQEIKYQDQIDKIERTNSLPEKPVIDFDRMGISLAFPNSLLNENVTGKIHFYRPSNPALDFEIPLRLNNDGSQFISTTQLTSGFWRLKLNWVMDGNEYYNEKEIIID
jgi:nitrogen fixation protein FixH